MRSANLGPFVDFSNDPGGAGLQMAAANGVLSPAERLDALLDRDAIYNVWIDVHNDTIQDGDRYSVHLQKEGVSGRMLVADGFVSDRSPEGSGVLGPTGPDLNALFVVTGSLQSATHNVLMGTTSMSVGTGFWTRCPGRWVGRSRTLG